MKANQAHLLDALQSEVKEEEISVESIKLEPYDDTNYVSEDYSQFCSTTIKEEQWSSDENDSTHVSRRKLRNSKLRKKIKLKVRR